MNLVYTVYSWYNYNYIDIVNILFISDDSRVTAFSSARPHENLYQNYNLIHFLDKLKTLRKQVQCSLTRVEHLLPEVTDRPNGLLEATCCRTQRLHTTGNGNAFIGLLSIWHSQNQTKRLGIQKWQSLKRSNKSSQKTAKLRSLAVSKLKPQTNTPHLKSKLPGQGLAAWNRQSRDFEIKREYSTCAYVHMHLYSLLAYDMYLHAYIHVYRHPRGCSNGFDSSLHVTVGNSVVIRIDNASCHIVRLSTELQRHGFPFSKVQKYCYEKNHQKNGFQRISWLPAIQPSFEMTCTCIYALYGHLSHFTTLTLTMNCLWRQAQ